MPTLADFGLTARPSARAAAATARGDSSPPERYAPSAEYLPLLQVTRNDAVAALQRSRPDLFKTPDQIRADILKNIGDRSSFGKSSRAKYITTEFNNALRGQKYAQAEAIDSTFKRMQSDAQREYDRQAPARLAEARRIAEETRRSSEEQRLAAERKSAADYETSSNEFTSAGRKLYGKRGDTLSEEDTRAMNFLEMSARVAMQENPQLYEGFEDYLSYSQQLASLGPSEREAELAALKEEANDIVDPYFDTKATQVRDDLKLSLQEIDDKFGLFTEAEKYQLAQKIDGLDRDAAETLANQFVDMKRRGIMDSGIARGVADKIIEGKTRSQDFEKTISEFEVKGQTMNKEYNVKKLNRSAERILTDIEHERETERGKQFFGLLGEEEARTFLQQYPSASRLNVYGDEPSPASVATPGMQGSAVPRRPLPSASLSAPSGSSLDLARRAAAGSISIDEQRRQRDLLLSSPKITPAPKSVAKTTVTPTPTRSTSPGSILLQNAARRKAERLAKAR